MLDFARNEQKEITIDLHNMQTAEARGYLTSRLDSMPANVHEVVVIHGYHGGTALQNMVRKFTHPRVKSKILGLNQGCTSLILK